eukprot:CAMPEP_0113245988 /NCGR_PEP_ID=MMETSP0008_2-20120614/9229_1 /TAXON_ID=97485 /ORGANISM="Prymnesium parvum" /LENGTH=88 /DNA_ID=CAMNT_0000093711 /DNA_START=1 /DNA_END=263 /DNA_ORIENTATION=- /assembly_acc=CAM_ASM_000153
MKNTLNDDKLKDKISEGDKSKATDAIERCAAPRALSMPQSMPHCNLPPPPLLCSLLLVPVSQRTQVARVQPACREGGVRAQAEGGGVG